MVSRNECLKVENKETDYKKREDATVDGAMGYDTTQHSMDHHVYSYPRHINSQGQWIISHSVISGPRYGGVWTAESLD